jgi:Domain of unknown function (DUF6268)
MKNNLLKIALAPFVFASIGPVSRAVEPQPDPLLPSLPGFSTTASFSSAGESDLKAGGAVSSTAYEVGVTQEIPFGETSSFEVGITYGNISLNQSKRNALTPLPDDLRSLSLDLNYNREINDTWSVSAGVSPGMRSAGSSFGSKGFSVEGYALATYNYSERLSFSAGLGFQSLGESSFGPAFGVNWIINEQWRASLGFPETAITYTLSETWEFSLIIESQGGAYYVENDPQPGAPGRPSIKGSNLEYNESRLGLAAVYHYSPSISVKVSAGTVLAQDFEYSDPKFKVKSDAGAAYFSAAVNVAF